MSDKRTKVLDLLSHALEQRYLFPDEMARKFMEALDAYLDERSSRELRPRVPTNTGFR